MGDQVGDRVVETSHGALRPRRREVTRHRGAHDARIVAGPSPLGVYTIVIETDGSNDELLSSLRDNPIVRFAGRSATTSLEEIE